MTEPLSKPRYEHDCTDCVYLGQHSEYDLYWCPQRTLGYPTLIARYASVGQKYLTYDVGLIGTPPIEEPFVTAYGRAVELRVPITRGE
jgi:hypothetical protein